MENLPQLVPLMIIIPMAGMTINLFWGYRLGEKWAGLIGTTAALLSFVVALLLFSYLSSNNYQSVIVNPPFLDGWLRIDSIGLEIPWQQRVDTLSVTMMLVVTGVGSLIHIYATGYMHGDPRFSRFFVYLNLFLAFMLVLVTGNNLLMLFVGWEGVGLCSFLLIGFWFDKTKGVGWKNSNAARKAFIVNRVGDFGLLMAIFLTFWTFGTLDFYKPTEVTNVELAAGGGPGEAAEGDQSAEGAAAEGEAVVAEAAEGEHGAEGEAVVAEEGGHSEEPAAPVYTNNDHLTDDQLGIFGQYERMKEAGADVDFGPFTLPLESVIVLITLFMLVGATGKSAQIPLFVWLPDAMAGPTPVSALIHAATMVTAGVYMMVRSNVFFYDAHTTSLIVTIIGSATAIIAGFIAMGQWDIKRVLAYSTVSQLGFMVAAVGIGAYSAAMFHLLTHAFFKALLFLGSGSVIHGMEHGHHHVSHHGHGHDDHHDDHHDEEFDPQDMRNMGGLRHKMPITYWTYLIGTLALAGIFPLAGFWSKDEILADSWIVGFVDGEIGGYIALGVLLAAAAFTAFYMWRQMELVFFGKPRSEAAEHAPESVASMTVPLLILGFFSIFVGFINTPSNVLGLDRIFGAHLFTDWLAPSVVHAHVAKFQPLIAISALVLAIGAILLARSIYGGGHALASGNRDRLQDNAGMGPLWGLANARLYWDETYFRLFENPFNRLSKFFADTLDWRFWHDYIHDVVIGKGFNAIGGILSKPVDLGIIDGIVNGVARLAQWASARVRNVQTGYVRTYAISLLLGVVLVIVILLLPLIQNG